MALTYPRTLNEDDVKSRGELRVFETLRDGLDDDWHVFHSVGWIHRDPAEGADDGEIDFVLCHPEQGILCLEVKGGGLECRHGNWFRIEGKQRVPMRDPFAQALDHRYDLQRKIAEQPEWKSRKLFISHGLAFPDISVHKLVLAPDAPAEIVIDRNGIADVAAGIERILDFHRGARDKREVPGEEGVEMLQGLLAPDVAIEVPMAAEFLEEEEHLIRLTSEQANLLARHSRAPRLAVYGCAGSGKTMLAVEQAKRLVRDGKDVLLVCFNRALRDHLRKREANSGIHFQHFHALCVELASKAGVELPRYPKDEAPQRFWDEELPDALLAAIVALGPQYDAIMVDEAQDLHNDWLSALMITLRDPDEGTVWLFLDDNQRIYRDGLDVPKEFLPYDLNVNCRNTQAIHREVMKKYEGEIVPQAMGPEGRDVELFKSAEPAETVAGLIERLCEKEEVPPQDVVVLSAHSWGGSEIVKSKPRRYTFVDESKPVGPYVLFSSIRSFKGLEAPAVILCELEDLDQATHDQELYVGLSRARNYCAVVAPG